MNNLKSAFFLGGYDLEMETIASLLKRFIPLNHIFDKRLAWGATVSQYAVELEAVTQKELVPVFIELIPDQPLPDNAVVIDHHNERAGANQPTSLEQVFSLLQRPQHEWTRQFQLIAANDRGYIPEMASIGATMEEMIAIREADRRSQGTTPSEERQGLEAVSRRRELANGRLTLIDIPHTRTATVCDRMESLLGGPGYKNLLVGTPSSSSFYGEGWLIDRLRTQIPGGWWGGALPLRGYWGAPTTVEMAIPVLVTALNDDVDPADHMTSKDISQSLCTESSLNNQGH